MKHHNSNLCSECIPTPYELSFDVADAATCSQCNQVGECWDKELIEMYYSYGLDNDFIWMYLPRLRVTVDHQYSLGDLETLVSNYVAKSKGTFSCHSFERLDGSKLEFNPYASTGNYNVGIYGSPGVGKQTLAKTLIKNHITQHKNHIVFTISDTGSFTRFTTYNGYEPIVPTVQAKFQINPFSYLADDSDLNSTNVDLVKNVIAYMAGNGNQLSDYQEAILSQHINTVIEMSWKNAKIEDVLGLCKESEDDRVIEMATNLEKWGCGVEFEDFFAENNPLLTVTPGINSFDLSGLHGNEDLLNIYTLLASCVVGTYLDENRSRVHSMLVTDLSSWLGSQNLYVSHSIVSISRRLRPSNCVGVNLFYEYEASSPCSNASLLMNNCHWNFILHHDNDKAIEALTHSSLPIDDTDLFKINSLKTSKSDGSKLLFVSPECKELISLKLEESERLEYSVDYYDQEDIDNVVRRGSDYQSALKICELKNELRDLLGSAEDKSEIADETEILSSQGFKDRVLRLLGRSK